MTTPHMTAADLAALLGRFASDPPFRSLTRGVYDPRSGLSLAEVIALAAAAVSAAPSVSEEEVAALRRVADEAARERNRARARTEADADGLGPSWHDQQADMVRGRDLHVARRTVVRLCPHPDDSYTATHYDAGELVYASCRLCGNVWPRGQGRSGPEEAVADAEG